MPNGSRLPNVTTIAVVAGLLLFWYTQLPLRLYDPSSCSKRTAQRTVYDRPGTLATRERFDGNSTGGSVPYWIPFENVEGGVKKDHGRLLERLLMSSLSKPNTSRSDNVGFPERFKGKTILFFGDSNERGIVDEICNQVNEWPSVISSSNPPSKSERWHADSHVCEIGTSDEDEGGKLRLVSFMGYGVLIEKGSKLWEKKLELNGPWDVEERIDLAKVFIEKMGYEVDLIVFNSNLWDLMYLHDVHLRLNTPYEFSLSAAILSTYIDRSLVALKRLRSSFPSILTLYRTLHPLYPGTQVDFFNDRRRTQLNEAALEIVSRAARDPNLDVRLLDVGRVLEGWPTKGKDHNILKDKVHMSWNPGLFMYGEMVLDVLNGL